MVARVDNDDDNDNDNDDDDNDNDDEDDDEDGQRNADVRMGVRIDGDGVWPGRLARGR